MALLQVNEHLPAALATAAQALPLSIDNALTSALLNHGKSRIGLADLLKDPQATESNGRVRLVVLEDAHDALHEFDVDDFGCSRWISHDRLNHHEAVGD